MSATPTPSPLRILLAAEDPADEELVQSTLNGTQHTSTVDVVRDAMDFEAHLRDSEYDVILIGHDLISWSGMQAVHALRTSGRTTPLIVLTSTLGEEVAVEYLKAGASDYVLKSHLSRLVTAIDRALSEKEVHDNLKQLQDQVFRGKREWELTFDAIPDPVFVIGEDCRIQRANRAAASVFDRTFDEIVGKFCYEVVHGREQPLPTCPHQCLLETGQNARGDIEEAHIGKVFHSSTSVLSDPDGVLRGCVHVLQDVTERTREELALRRQALVFENIYNAVVLVDESDKIVDWNPAATKMFGFTKDYVFGRNISCLFPSGLAKKYVSAIKKSLDTHERWLGELPYVRKDGTDGLNETVIVPLRNEHGEQTGFIGVSRDITDLKQAEQALRNSEEKYRLLFDRNPQPMWVYDVETLRFLAVNQAAVAHYGYSREEFLSMTLKDIRPNEDVPAMVESARRAEAAVDRAGLWRHRTREGRILYVDISDCRIQYEGVAASLVLANDVTETMRAEKAMQESEEKYRGLVENACYGIYRSTVDGKLLDVNPAFVALLGYDSKEELLGVNLETSVYHDPAERRRIIREEAIHQGRVQLETILRRKDGALIRARIDGRGIRGSNREFLYFEVIVEDVTQQRETEEKYRQAQKMEAVGRLAGGIAHDFNNVLMVINSYAEMIISRELQDPSAHRYAGQILQAGKKAASLTSKLLAFSRKQVLQPSVVDLRSVVSDIGNLLKPMLGDDIEISMSAETELGNVYADRSQIEQVLMNLAVNARDAMAKGGRLNIDLQNVTVDDHYIQRHPQIAPGRYVVLAVSDSGIGMDAATQAKIFEPFFTTKGVGKGTGLGLATVYGIIKQSGGFVWVYSEVGIGTTFKIYLPQVFRQAVAPADPNDTKCDFTGSSETILLVDDERDLRGAAREFLEAKGYRVLEAENGAGALGICTAHQGPIQALVTDLIMPGMRGPELAAKVSTLHPGIKTIYMSGYSDRSQDVKGLGRGIIFLQKPFSLNTLAQKLHTALRESRQASAD